MFDKLNIKNNNDNEDLSYTNRKLVGLFMHYDNGDIINIQDLPKLEYEKFLEQMNILRITYFTIINHH